MAPTLWRNQAATGRLVIADSSTFNLWVGLNDIVAAEPRRLDRLAGAAGLARQRARPSPNATPCCARASAPFMPSRASSEPSARQLGKQYFRLFEKDSYLTDQLPHGSLAPAGQGYHGMASWLAGLLRGLAWSSHLLVLALAGLGLALAPAPGRSRPWSWLGPRLPGLQPG